MYNIIAVIGMVIISSLLQSGNFISIVLRPRLSPSLQSLASSGSDVYSH